MFVFQPRFHLRPSSSAVYYSIQGAVLGPILFLLHVAVLQFLIEDRGLCPHHQPVHGTTEPYF